MIPDADQSSPAVDKSAAAERSPSHRGSKAVVGALLACLAGIAILLFLQFSDGSIRPGTAPAQAACTKGQADCLPDLSYVDTTGVAYSRDSLAGKVVLVNFWATWCKPCEKEIPDLSRVYNKYRAKGVVFLGVLVDRVNSQQLLNFQSDHDMTYPVVRANDELMASYNHPDAYPKTLVYDRRGKQVLDHLGAMRERDLDSLLSALVPQN